MLKILGISMIFRGGAGGLCLGLGWGVVQIQRKKFQQIINTYFNVDRYQCLKLVYSDSLSSFFTKLSNNNMGTSQGVSDAPCDATHHGRGI